jgi:hypothetical protein
MRDWLHHLLLPSRAANLPGSIHRPDGFGGIGWRRVEANVGLRRERVNDICDIERYALTFDNHARVKLRNTLHEQMSSALPSRTDASLTSSACPH